MDKQAIDLYGKTILVTGAAGFIGAALVMRLASNLSGATIIGIDSMNSYYDVSLKEYRLRKIEENFAESENSNLWHFERGSIADERLVEKMFGKYSPDIVVNLAAQAGVGYSIDHPRDYIESNIIGFFNILEACRHSCDNAKSGVEHFVYASSSSVYGANAKIPYSTNDKTDSPVSLYAATKKSNELLAHAYAKLYNIPSTGLRFFTVYGQAGRPDMAYFKFTNKLRNNEMIKIYNYGNCERDFTYIDDIVEGMMRVMRGSPKRKKGDDGLPIPPTAVYNIGGGHPVNLMEFVRTLSEELIKADVLPKNYDFDAHIKLVPMQPGDVAVIYADTKALERDYGYRPMTGLRHGLGEFARWYKESLIKVGVYGER